MDFTPLPNPLPRPQFSALAKSLPPPSLRTSFMDGPFLSCNSSVQICDELLYMYYHGPPWQVIFYFIPLLLIYARDNCISCFDESVLIIICVHPLGIFALEYFDLVSFALVSFALVYFALVSGSRSYLT